MGSSFTARVLFVEADLAQLCCPPHLLLLKMERSHWWLGPCVVWTLLGLFLSFHYTSIKLLRQLLSVLCYFAFLTMWITDSQHLCWVIDFLHALPFESEKKKRGGIVSFSWAYPGWSYVGFLRDKKACFFWISSPSSNSRSVRTSL